jgi:hypothetical protein
MTEIMNSLVTHHPLSGLNPFGPGLLVRTPTLPWDGTSKNYTPVLSRPSSRLRLDRFYHLNKIGDRKQAEGPAAATTVAAAPAKLRSS